MRSAAALALCLCVLAPVTNARAQDDWDATRSGFDAAVVRRYKAILERDPHDADALRRLVAIYKQYKTVALLTSEYEAQGDTWSALSVLAHMPGVTRDAAAAYLRHALALKADDGRGWIALGEATLDSKIALDAFTRATAIVAAPRDKQRALEGQLAAARALHDAAAIDAAYAAMIARRPRDGRLGLDRRDAQLAANKPADAFTSFGEAEKRLRTDPERRLAAMTSKGVALERQGRIDEAVNQWELTLDAVPRGYYLGDEVVQHIIAVERKRKRLGVVSARLDARWPERQRGYLEWATLGDLRAEEGDGTGAIAAYRKAVAKAPTEVGTQRKLIALLDKQNRRDEALAQHDLVARLAPGDATIQLELAERYGKANRGAALAVLARLSKRLRGNVNVRVAIAKLYDEWDELPLAIAEYRAVADLEPDDIDHALVLGETYWRAGDIEHAREAWARLSAVGTLAALLRQGDVLASHDQWEHAVAAYTAAGTKDATSADAWRGRARALDELGRHAEASVDARRAVALVGTASESDGMRERGLLVGVLNPERRTTGLAERLARWQFAFERGDNAAGYLLVAHYARLGSTLGHSVLVELYRRVPEDSTLGVAVARSYAKRSNWGRARNVLEGIGRRHPEGAKDVASLIDQFEKDEKREEVEARFAEEDSRRDANDRDPDLVGRANRIGFRVLLGSDVRNTTSALGGFGMYRYSRLAPATALSMRLEWFERDDHREERDVIAFGAGVARRLLDLRKLEVAAGIGARAEFRYAGAEEHSTWNRVGLGADATLEVLPRGVPATLGLRATQSLTDDTHGTTLAVELGFEFR